MKMLFPTFIFIVLYCIDPLNAYIPCKGNTIVDVISFDDVQCPVLYQALPRPYHGFVFRRVNTFTGYVTDDVAMMNTTSGTTSYRTGASSTPNILFTTGENIVFTKVHTRSVFGVRALKLSSIYLNQMGMTIIGSRNGQTRNMYNITLPLNQLVSIELDWDNVDMITIGCSNPTYEACAHATYDDLTLCV